MNSALRKGFSFGLTSGIITTLGLIVGLNSSTHSRTVIAGGVLAVAIADAFSDALGIHLAEESGKNHSSQVIWGASGMAFLAKIFFAASFLLPILFLELNQAIIVSLIWGFSLLTLLSVSLARQRKTSVSQAILEHLGIALIVILLTHYLGRWSSTAFD